MKISNFLRVTAFVTVAAFTASTTGSSVGSIFAGRKNADPVGSIQDSVTEVSVAEEGVNDIEKLNFSVENGNSDRISRICDSMITEMENARAESDKVAADISQWADEEIISRQQRYDNRLNVKYAETVKALNELKEGINSAENLALINENLAEPAEYHRSDATPNMSVQPVEKTVSASPSESGTEIVSPPATADDLVYDRGVSDPAVVKEMAEKLGNTNDIFLFVKNNIENEAYAGSKKDPAITLEQLGANDIDQAALLISLLRAKGVPARFVSGMIRITPEQAVEITGASDAESAGRVLAARYKNTARLEHKGKLVGYRMYHTWVEAFVPYTDYRGTGNGSGDSVWIQLDPSFKNVAASTQTVSYEQNASSEKLLETVEKGKKMYPGKFDDIKTSTGKTTLHFVNVDPRNDEYLPASLPYTVLEADKRYSFIADEDMTSVSITIDGEKLFDELVPYIYGKTLVISYIPADESDRSVIEHYGDIMKVPAYLVNVVPEVTCGSTKICGKKAVSLGAVQNMVTAIKDGTGTTMLDDSIYAGSMYAVNLDLQHISSVDMEYAEKRLNSRKEGFSAGNSFTPEVMGAMLDYAGKYYFTLCDSQSVFQSSMNNILYSRQLGLAITGYQFNKHSTCGVVDSLEDGSFYIDVAYNKTNAVSLSGSREDEKSFNTVLGAEESFLEGYIWEELLDKNKSGISTVKVIAVAAELGISTVIMTTTNVEEQLAKCNIPEYVRQEIRDFVSRGMAVEAVPEMLNIGDWTGTAYIAYDITTGNASYMLSGGTAGGATQRFINLVEINQLLSFANSAMASIGILHGLIDFKKGCYKNDGVEAVKGIRSAFSGSEALGAAYKMRFSIICYAIDFAIDGASAVDAFEEETQKNIDKTLSNYADLCATMTCTALEDIGGIIGEIINAYEKYQEVKDYVTTTKDVVTDKSPESVLNFGLLLAEIISKMFKRD